MSHAAAATAYERQRELPRFDRRTPRRGVSGGGVDQADGLRRLPRPLGLGTANDTRILRDRGPWLHVEQAMPAGISWISWTKAGPVRPELHMSNSTYRVEQGTSNTRYPVVATPTTGRHTRTPGVAARTAPRYQATAQMRPPRQNRLLPGRYSGQTYSQTTRLQGR